MSKNAFRIQKASAALWYTNKTEEGVPERFARNMISVHGMCLFPYGVSIRRKSGMKKIFAF
jgi:hypothetical protein|tara:strand:- start:140 stop:322 length:183 start_codon:yes stop_codon:yes gene_type:complete